MYLSTEDLRICFVKGETQNRLSFLCTSHWNLTDFPSALVWKRGLKYIFTGRKNVCQPYFYCSPQPDGYLGSLVPHFPWRGGFEEQEQSRNLGDLILAYLTLPSSPSFAREILVWAACANFPVVCWLSLRCLWRTHGCDANTCTCISPASSTRGPVQSSDPGTCSFAGPLEGRAAIADQECEEKEVTLLCSSNRRACSCILNSVPIKLTITFSDFISSSAESDLLIFSFHFCDVKRNERKGFACSFLLQLQASLGYLNCDENTVSQCDSIDRAGIRVKAFANTGSSDFAHPATNMKCCSRTSTDFFKKKPLG